MKKSKSFFIAIGMMSMVSISVGQRNMHQPKTWKHPLMIEKADMDMEKEYRQKMDAIMAVSDTSLLEGHRYRPAIVTTQSETGDSLYKYIYTYDDLGMDYGGNASLSEEQLVWDRNTQSWGNYLRLKRVLDENHKIIAGYTEASPGTDEWIPFARVTHQYDERGNKTDGMQANWTNNGWYDNYHYTVKYDEKDRKIEEYYENRFTSSSWQHTSLFTWEYGDNDNLIKEEMLQYVGGEYESTLLIEYEYDENGNRTALQQSQYGEKAARTEYAYDANNNKIKELNLLWVDSLELWRNIACYQYTYDSLDRMATGLLLRADSTGEQWDSIERFTYRYQYTAAGYGREGIFTERYNDSTELWEGFSEEWWYYNESGRGKLTQWPSVSPPKVGRATNPSRNRPIPIRTGNWSASFGKTLPGIPS